MKIDRRLEKEFVRILQIKRYDRTIREQKILEKRNRIIESQFELNDKVCKKLERLNEILLNEEERIFIQYRAIEANAKLLAEKGLIDDYEIDLELSFWNNFHYIKFDPEIEGNPFYESQITFMMMQHGETYETIDCTERSLTGDTPITRFDHCFSFHDLYYHTNDLTWFDVCNIDEIWMKIKVDYQFFQKYNKTF